MQIGASGAKLVFARLLSVALTLKHDRGTLVVWEVPDCISDLFTWDARAQLWRTPGQNYRSVIERLRDGQIPYKDEAADFGPLELRPSRDLKPYLHQVEALAAWKEAGRRGVVVLPTGAGKNLCGRAGHASDTAKLSYLCADHRPAASVVLRLAGRVS